MGGSLSFVCTCLLAVLLFLAGPAFAVEEQPAYEHLARLLQERYEKTVDITADFSQETIPAGAAKGLKAEGVVYFKRPHLMRWEYRLPEPQLIVTAGEDVYVYEEEVRQVMILPRDQFLSSEISKAFFFGEGDLEKFFEVGPSASSGPESDWTLGLTPREPVPQVQKIWITVDPDTHLVREMWIDDELGGKTHLSFGNFRLDTGLDAGLFRFEIPEGVDVYRSDGG